MEIIEYKKLKFEQYLIVKNQNYMFLNKKSFNQLINEKISDEVLKEKIDEFSKGKYLLKENLLLSKQYEKLFNEYWKNNVEEKFKIISKKYLMRFENIFLFNYFETKNFYIYFFRDSEKKKYLIKVSKNKKIQVRKEIEFRKICQNIHTSILIDIKKEYIIEEYLESEKKIDSLQNIDVYNQIKKIHENFCENPKSLIHIKKKLQKIYFDNKAKISEETYQNLLLLSEKLSDCKNLIHGDLHNENIIYSLSNITFIDFQESFLGDPDIDFFIRYTYTHDSFWLTCIKDKEKIIIFELITTIGILLEHKKYKQIEEIFKVKTIELNIQNIKKISEIIKNHQYLTVIKKEKIDFLTQRILFKELNSEKNILKLIDGEITFQNFLVDDVQNILTKENFIRYYKNNQEYNLKNTLKIKKQISTYIKNKSKEIEILLHNIEFFPIPRFYFGFEKNNDERIQWIFPLSSNKQKKILKKILDDLNLYTNNFSFLFDIDFSNTNLEICLGLNFKNTNCVRKSIYFLNIDKNIELLEILKKTFNLNLDLNKNQHKPNIIGFDFFEKHFEYKLYFMHKKNTNYSFYEEFVNEPYEEVFKYKQNSSKFVKKIGFFVDMLSEDKKRNLFLKNTIEENISTISIYLNKKNEIKEIKKYVKIT